MEHTTIRYLPTIKEPDRLVHSAPAGRGLMPDLLQQPDKQHASSELMQSGAIADTAGTQAAALNTAAAGEDTAPAEVTAGSRSAAAVEATPAEATARIFVSEQVVPSTAVDPPVGSSPTASLLHVISSNVAKRNNLHFVDAETIIMAVGSVVLLLHLPTMQQHYLPGRDGGGVAAVAVHPSKQFFLVAEKCRSRAPNIYVYQYPSLALAHTLPQGTEIAYSCAVFSNDGSMIASVGSGPDYLLTLWDWKAGTTLLRCKAFSQEVYDVRFSAYIPGNLVTCGTGHIRFWKMATTFTGLKLQGQIGKFGALELSDVAAFVEMPDGKVLSGSESGALLIWDGGLIKAVLCRSGGAPCHAGAVQVLVHDTQTNYVLSGGDDGMLRLWDCNKLNDAEPGENDITCEVRPAAEVPLPAGGGVRGVLWDKRSWLVQDTSGALHMVTLPINLLDSKGYVITKLLDLHSGAVHGAVTCSDRHVLITVSAADSRIRAFDYRFQQQQQARQFQGHASCMAILPAGVDPQQCTAVIGFTDGIMRVVRLCADGWILLAAEKPHKVPITCLALSSDGSKLAAVAENSRIFFFQFQPNDGTLTPQFSCKVPASGPTSCSWSHDGRHLLVGFNTGVAIEVAVPGPASIDTTRTYEQPADTRTYTVQMPWQQKVRSTTSQRQQQQQLFQQQHLEQKQQESEQPSRAADGSEAAQISTQAEKQQQQAPQSPAQMAPSEEDVDPFQKTPVLPITWLQHKEGSSDRFMLWVGGSAAGQVLECSWNQLLPLSSTSAVDGAAVTAVSTSWSGRYQLLGTADGRVVVEGRDASTGTPNGRRWECAVHDMQEGTVRAVAMAHDDSCLITAAADGTVMLLKNPLGPASADAAAAAAAAQAASDSLPSTAEEVAAHGQQHKVTDLLSDSLSLEEAKQSAQANQQAAAAEAARQQLAAGIEKVRAELAALVAGNEARPPGERVDKHMLQVDTGLDALVEHERQERLADAHAQAAYDTEVATLQLSKLQQYFAAQLLVPYFTLHSFNGNGSVSSLRQAELPQELLFDIYGAEAEEAQHQLIKQQLAAPGKSAVGVKAPDQPAAEQPTRAATGHAQSQQQVTILEPSSTGLTGPGSSSATPRAEVWRQAKRARAAEWAAFNASKPVSTYEAPADVAAVEEAAATIGDYKLKIDPGYVLPEDQRMTPSKKRRQMLLLMRDMAAAQTSYNKRVLGLRDSKRSLVAQHNKAAERLALLNQLLGIHEAMPRLAMLPEEEPEQQLTIITPAQLEQHAAAKKAAATKAAGGDAGLGGFVSGGGAGGAKGTAPASKAAADADSKGGTHAGSANGAQTAAPDSCVAAAAPGGLPAALSQAERRWLEVDRQQLLSEMLAQQSAFDGSLASCRQSRFELAVGLKAAEGQLLLMAKELEVLKDAQVRELVLEGKRADKAQDQAELAARLAEVNRSLDAKRAEGGAAAARKAAVMAELDVMLADQQAFRDSLTKIFNRRVKRSRRQAGSGGDGGDGSSDEGSDADEEDGGKQDSDEDDDAGDEVCPPGCEPGLYERVVELRERRLDDEEVAAEVSKVVEGIKKEREQLSKKAKLLEQSLAAINQDLLAFQQEKQGRLNQLPAIVALRLHQISHLEGGGLPADLSGGLVFSQQQLARLKQRMQELDTERAWLKQQQKELQRQASQLAADRAAKEAHLAELTGRCRDVQMLKFGQVIDVSLLDMIGVRNQGADELRKALKQQGHSSTAELTDWDARIAAKRRELLAMTRENTNTLNTVTGMARTQRSVEAAVMEGRSALWQDPLDNKRAALAQRDKLVATIHSQAGVLEALRNQIAVMRRKDTAVCS